jgi:hypothetical protein
MSLMKFADTKERDAVLGPLYANEAKANIPIFGSGSKEAKAALNSTIKQFLQSDVNPVVDLLSKTIQTPGGLGVAAGSISEDLEKLQMEASSENGQVQRVRPDVPKITSSREKHDASHYTMRGKPEEPKTDKLDHVMLQRALDGYLFNCKLNQTLIKDDPWLRNVWEWMEGKSSPMELEVLADI